MRHIMSVSLIITSAFWCCPEGLSIILEFHITADEAQECEINLHLYEYYCTSPTYSLAKSNAKPQNGRFINVSCGVKACYLQLQPKCQFHLQMDKKNKTNNNVSQNICPDNNLDSFTSDRDRIHVAQNRDSSPQNENSVINYSHSCRSRNFVRIRNKN